MAKGIDISVAADTRSAMSAIKRGIIEPLEDAADVLEDLGTESKDTGNDLEKSMRDAQRRTEDAKDEIRELRDEVNKAGRGAKDFGNDGKKAFGVAEEAAGEFKDEALSNFSEVASSFDGSMSSIQDLAQGTLGGLASTGLPGVGIAAGIAAAGIGLIGAGLEKAEERRLILEERANDLAQAYMDAGSTILDSLTLVDRFTSILQDPETRKEAQSLAKMLGGDLALATRVLAGDEQALEAARGAATTMMERQELGAYELNRALDEQSGVMQDAKQDARLISDQYYAMMKSAGKATMEVDELGNELYTLPDGKQIVVDAKTGLASQNIERFKGDVDGIKRTVETTVKVRVDDRAWVNWTPKTKYGIVQGAVRAPKGTMQMG